MLMFKNKKLFNLSEWMTAIVKTVRILINLFFETNFNSFQLPPPPQPPNQGGNVNSGSGNQPQQNPSNKNPPPIGFNANSKFYIFS